jgi:ferredoxin
MADAVVRFSIQNIEGAVPVGSKLSDVMKRFGIRLDPPCDAAAGEHFCVVMIESGAEYLSSASDAELEHLAKLKRKSEFRIACYMEIVGSGEITVMTEEKKEGSKTAEGEEKKTSKLVDEFEALPLEKKIADLVRMEAVALGETISFVINSPYMVLEKVVDVLAEFGMKLDREPKSEPAKAEPERGKQAKSGKSAKGPASSNKKKPAARPTRRPPSQ